MKNPIEVEGAFSGIIPKNPWVAVAVLGGLAVVVYVLFEEFNSTIAKTAATAESAPGAVVSQTLQQTATGIATAWDTLIYNPLHNLFSPSTATPNSASAVTPGTNVGAITGASL